VAGLPQSRAFLCDFLAACLAGHGKRKSTRFVLPAGEGPLIEDLAAAWAALPLGMQRTSVFAAGIDEGCPVDANFSTTSGTPVSSSSSVGPNLIQCVNRYVNLLLDGPQDSSDLLRSEITSVMELEKAVEARTNPMPLAPPEPDVPVSSGKAQMPRKPRNTDSHRPRTRDKLTSVDTETASELDRQFTAMEASLKAYIDRRFDDWEQGQPRSAGGGSKPKNNVVPGGGGMWPGWPVWMVVGALGVAAAAIFLVFSLFKLDRDFDEPRKKPAIIEDSVATTSSAVDNTRDALTNREVLAAAIVQAQKKVSGPDGCDPCWAEALRTLIGTHPALVSAAVRAVAAGDPAVVPDDSIRQLNAIARKIDEGTDLEKEGRAELRAMLLEFIVASLPLVDTPPVKVDANLNDITPALLRDVKRDYAPDNPSTYAGDLQLQAEIILRWMEKREP
jgi:uncharacterized protein YnzC (UPF0291/DUF896 family)